mmetsp:Transcript_37558/g.82394  ORF Transcript_37558/g.82394 Transcript_37558/m.82394 type:complete len:278 (-) Transcript_37558:1081-1914(-)
MPRRQCSSGLLASPGNSWCHAGVPQSSRAVARLPADRPWDSRSSEPRVRIVPGLCSSGPSAPDGSRGPGFGHLAAGHQLARDCTRRRTQRAASGAHRREVHAVPEGGQGHPGSASCVGAVLVQLAGHLRGALHASPSVPSFLWLDLAISLAARESDRGQSGRCCCRSQRCHRYQPRQSWRRGRGARKGTGRAKEANVGRHPCLRKHARRVSRCCWPLAACGREGGLRSLQRLSLLRRCGARVLQHARRRKTWCRRRSAKRRRGVIAGQELRAANRGE